jgi:hypothetical protein
MLPLLDNAILCIAPFSRFLINIMRRSFRASQGIECHTLVEVDTYTGRKGLPRRLFSYFDRAPASLLSTRKERPTMSRRLKPATFFALAFVAALAVSPLAAQPATGNQAEVRFTHQGLVPAFECFDACSSAWGFLVNDSLRSLITTGKGKPLKKSGEQR